MGQKCSLAEEGCAKEQGSQRSPWLWSVWVMPVALLTGSSWELPTAAPMGFALVWIASVLAGWAKCFQHCRACGEQGTSEL